MRLLRLAIIGVAAVPCVAGASTDRLPMLLLPVSRTAEAITGRVVVHGDRVVFASKTVPAKNIGRFTRTWSPDGSPALGTVYRLQRDPGPLRGGNRLCGKGAARFIVIWHSNEPYVGHLVNMSAFASAQPPFDGLSRTLCGTFSYSLAKR